MTQSILVNSKEKLTLVIFVVCYMYSPNPSATWSTFFKWRKLCLDFKLHYIYIYVIGMVCVCAYIYIYIYIYIVFGEVKEILKSVCKISEGEAIH